MMPLNKAWVEGESPLINPAGPDCGLKIQAVITAAATPPMINATVCWSLNGFFISIAVRLTWVHGAPHDGNGLGGGKIDHDL